MLSFSEPQMYESRSYDSPPSSTTKEYLFVFKLFLCSLAIAVELWGDCVPVTSDLYSDPFQMSLDCRFGHSFRECVRQVIVCPDFVRHDYFRPHFLLKSQLNDFNVADFA